MIRNSCSASPDKGLCKARDAKVVLFFMRLANILKCFKLSLQRNFLVAPPD